LFVEETEKEGVRELFAVVVKLLLTRSVCCLVYIQRKESCNMGVSTGVKCGQGVLLTTHPLLVPRSWKSRAIPLPTLWATLGL
jgi:hypothetical protein